MTLDTLLAAKAAKRDTFRSEIIAALPVHTQSPITVSELLARLPGIFDRDHSGILREMEMRGEIRWIPGLPGLAYRLQLTPKVVR